MGNHKAAIGAAEEYVDLSRILWTARQQFNNNHVNYFQRVLIMKISRIGCAYYLLPWSTLMVIAPKVSLCQTELPSRYQPVPYQTAKISLLYHSVRKKNSHLIAMPDKLTIEEGVCHLRAFVTWFLLACLLYHCLHNHRCFFIRLNSVV